MSTSYNWDSNANDWVESSIVELQYYYSSLTPNSISPVYGGGDVAVFLPISEIPAHRFR